MFQKDCLACTNCRTWVSAQDSLGGKLSIALVTMEADAHVWQLCAGVFQLGFEHRSAGMVICFCPDT